jgi:hypothetical protein
MNPEDDWNLSPHPQPTMEGRDSQYFHDNPYVDKA